mmetsp:Transcript_34835/g.63632  ORF Transcript_34835/g.63632 Transcript_34835/m.63632 type:complete len:240 (-) Transcript_34835:341-1060(-)
MLLASGQPRKLFRKPSSYQRSFLSCSLERERLGVAFSSMVHPAQASHTWPRHAQQRQQPHSTACHLLTSSPSGWVNPRSLYEACLTWPERAIPPSSSSMRSTPCVAHVVRAVSPMPRAASRQSSSRRWMVWGKAHKTSSSLEPPTRHGTWTQRFDGALKSESTYHCLRLMRGSVCCSCAWVTRQTNALRQTLPLSQSRQRTSAAPIFLSWCGTQCMSQSADVEERRLFTKCSVRTRRAR